MIIRRLRYWLGSARRERELRAEMEAHLEELSASGLSPDEARRRFGNFGAAQDDAREVWIARRWAEFAQDVRYALRALKRNPGFTVVAVASAALGIGACTTVFSLANFALFRPLHVAEAERLMTITGMKRGGPGGALSYAEVRDMGRGGRAWTGVAAFDPMVAAGIQGHDGVRRAWGFLVTANFFDVVQPGFALGRGFTAGADDVAGAPARIVLSNNLWRFRFGADPDIVGREVMVNRRPMTVVGVTAAGFQGTEVGMVSDYYLPFSQLAERSASKDETDRAWLERYDSQWLTALARLRPGSTVAQAQAELNGISDEIRTRVAKRPPGRRFYAERAGQLTPFLRRLAVPAFVLLMGVTLLVLLTACANVANLMLARASARGREIATRIALGAGRARLVRQLLTESLLLGLSGGVLGLGLAEWAGRHIGAFRLPIPIPVDLTATVDHRVALFAMVLALVVTLAFGLAPALGATRPSGATVAPRTGPRNALVVAQVAVSTVLVIGSALALRSLSATRQVDPGLDPRQLILVQFDPSLSRYDGDKTARLIEDVLAGAATVPGVRSASVVDILPLSLASHTMPVAADGGAAESVAILSVGPRYFETAGTPLLAGLELASETDAVIVNQELARRLWPGQNALGRYLSFGGRRARVVGVAANAKYRALQESATPILYQPILAAGASWRGMDGVTLLARTSGPAVEVGRALADSLRRRDASLVVNSVTTMEAHVDDALFLPRLAASLLGLCGAMGLFIAAIGIYGVVSFAVERRRRELAIRMALGARAGQVLGMVLRHGAVLAVVGITLGLAAGLALARLARSLIYGVDSADPLTFVSVPVLLMAVALVATAVPARRAAATDPNGILRAE